MNLPFRLPNYPPEVTQSRLLKLAAVFLSLSALILTLSPTAQARSLDTPLRWRHWGAIIVWSASFYLLNKRTQNKLDQTDPFLLSIMGLLTGWGILNIWRVTPTFGLRQTIWLIVAAGIFLIGLNLPSDLGLLRRYKYLILTSGIILTTLTLIFGTNPLGQGPRLWLGCCGIYLQPSEPLKLLLIVFLAAYLADRQPLTPNILSLLAPTGVMIGVTLLLLIVQRDLGTASIFVFIYTGVIYIAIRKHKTLLLSLFLLAASGIGGYLMFDVVRLRVDAWINPWLDPFGRSYQIVQSLISVAAGGMTGRGPGMGSPGLVPIAHSDFIFSTIAEEYGLAGTIPLLLLFTILIIRGFRIAIQAANRYHRYLAAGLSIFLASQTILIIGGNIRLLPLTGVTLPFVSYGGSSLVTSYLAILLLVHVKNHSSGHSPSLIKNSPIVILSGFFITAFAALAILNSWWALWQGPDLLTRPDNARRTISDRIVLRGSILDRNGNPLVVTQGASGDYQRIYLHPPLSSIIGYTQPFYGQAGAEAALDPILRGLENQNPWAVWINRLLYGQPPPGLDVKLSIDLELQIIAEESLGDIPGAVILMNAENGEILVMASNPSYDPNQLDEIWDELNARKDAPLVNRAAQGRYPPGEALEPFLLAAEDSGKLNDQAILAFFTELGFFSPPNLRLPTAYQETPDSLVYEDLRLSPLQIALAATSLSNGGEIPAPHFLIEVKNPEGGWDKYPPLGESLTIFEGSIANKIANTFAHDSFPIWQLVAVTASQTGQPLTWYLGGTLPGAKSPYVVVVLLEVEDIEMAEEIGKMVLFFFQGNE